MRCLLAAALLFALSIPAGAASIDFSQVILDERGEAADDATVRPRLPNGALDATAKQVDLTLGTVAATALMASYQDDAATGDEKFKRGQLAVSVRKGETINIPAEDVALIKRMIAKAWPPLVVYRAWSLLEGSK